MTNRFRVKLLADKDLTELNRRINEFMESDDIKYVKGVHLKTTRESLWYAQINYIIKSDGEFARERMMSEREVVTRTGRSQT